MALDRLPSVLIPDRYGGLVVCDIDDLLARCMDEDDLDEAITNAGFDSLMGFKPTLEQLTGLIARVRKLNETGDAAGYWDSQS